MKHERRDYAHEMVEQILDLLRAGTTPWRACWEQGGGGRLPLRHNGEPYRGMNVLMLWSAAVSRGYTSPYWLTFRQALASGGTVRKGERGRPVCWYGGAEQEDVDSSEARSVRYLKHYTVFNAQQVDGLPSTYHRAVPTGPAPAALPAVDAWIARIGAEIRWGGTAAYYDPRTDHIQMPDANRFRDAEQMACVQLHELTHWTGAAHRLDRRLDRYAESRAHQAFEELVAEIGSGLLGAQHGFAPEHLEDHARYIGCWITELQNQPKYLFGAAAQAQAAVDELNRRAGRIEIVCAA